MMYERHAFISRGLSHFGFFVLMTEDYLKLQLSADLDMYAVTFEAQNPFLISPLRYP